MRSAFVGYTRRIQDLRDRLVASDTALERFRLAARATLAVLLSGAALAPLVLLAHVPGPVAVLGALISLWATLAATDPQPRARRITAALLPLAAIAAVEAGALLSSFSPPLASAWFVVVAFLAVWLRKFGPRGSGMGTMGLFATFFALFVAVKPDAIVAVALSVTIGCAIAWLVTFALVSDDPRFALRASAAAFAARVRLLSAVASRVAAGSEPDAERALRAELRALNEVVLPLDRILAGDALALAPAEQRSAREALFRTELLLDELARAARARRADAAPLDDGAARLAAERTGDLLRAAAHAKATGRADAPLSPAASPPQVGSLAPTTRQALQVAVATGLALLLGTAVPPHQYFWAVLTAFIVYSGTASAAETRRRTWGRVFGTAIGVAVGFVLVDVVRGHTALEAPLAVVFLFAAVYAFRASYTVFTFFFTALVAIVYDVVGKPADQLLLARLIETMVGALCAGVAATFVLPLRTREVVAVTTKAFAARLRESIDTSLARLLESADGDPLAAARAVDAQLAEVLARLEPLLQPTRSHKVPSDDDTIVALAACGAHVRDLALQALDAPGSARGAAGALAAARSAVDATIDAWGTVLDGRPAAVPDDRPAAEAADAAPENAGAAHVLRLIAEDLMRLSGDRRTLLLPPSS